MRIALVFVTTAWLKVKVPGWTDPEIGDRVCGWRSECREEKLLLDFSSNTA